MYKLLVEKYIFTIFACELFKVKMKKNVNNTRNTLHLGQILLNIVVRSLQFMFMQMDFSKVHPTCHNIVNGIKPGSNSK